MKAEATRRAEAAIGAQAVFATNTSTLPISGLAQHSVRPAMHSRRKCRDNFHLAREPVLCLRIMPRRTAPKTRQSRLRSCGVMPVWP
jgi:hypothetical protein